MQRIFWRSRSLQTGPPDKRSMAPCSTMPIRLGQSRHCFFEAALEVTAAQRHVRQTSLAAPPVFQTHAHCRNQSKPNLHLKPETEPSRRILRGLCRDASRTRSRCCRPLHLSSELARGFRDFCKVLPGPFLGHEALKTSCVGSTSKRGGAFLDICWIGVTVFFGLRLLVSRVWQLMGQAPKMEIWSSKT